MASARLPFNEEIYSGLAPSNSSNQNQATQHYIEVTRETGF
ncbi:MAG: hypothetical protein AAF579_12740 [Cyanobacteria bacterium P01_C01_bin.118]